MVLLSHQYQNFSSGHGKRLHMFYSEASTVTRIINQDAA